MKSFKSLILSIAALALTAIPAAAAIPWGTTGAPLQVSGATPTCTYTATALACIEDMTANVTSITLAGMTAGTYYSIILMQDGTGSRTLAQTSITGAPALSTAESAANGYAVWIIKATSASKASFVTDYDNAPIFADFKQAQTTAGTAVTGGTIQAQSTVVAPGMSAANACICDAQTLPASWQTAVSLACLPETNAVQCVIYANNGVVTITPTAVSVNIRLLP
jgi:hypothetical protein